MKEHLLREHDLTLDKAINICRSTEESKKQLKTMSEEKADPMVHAVKPAPANSEEKSSIPHGKIDRCRNCGLQHGRDSCPARGRKCHKCHRMNHFAKLCRSGQVSTIGKDEETSDGKQQYMIGTIKENGVVVSNNECFSTFQVNGVVIKFKIDTGSQVNVLPWNIFKQMSKRPHLDTAKIRLIGYTGDALSVVGRCELIVQGHLLEFYIVRTNQSPILGLKASQDLHVIKVIMNIGCQSILSQYSKVFEGLGCLSKSYHIKVDPEVTPVICPPRNQPVAIRDRLKHELDDMESLGVIKKEEEPTDWVNSLVVVEKPKSKKLRICLDPRPLNKAILREHFQLPTLEDTATCLSGARIFSKLDANHGYWQIPLDDESQQLTTFNSPFGRYCFTRMPFGIKSAQEIFQKRMTQNFGDLEGVETDIDDILVWGKTEEEHHKRLKAVLQRCQDIHLTLNMEKCKFGAPQVTYLGHIISAAGISLDKDRVKAISEMPPPTDRKGVERILRTLNYVAKFVPDMSMITQPIRELLKQDTQFIWEYEQEAAFEAIKTRLSTAPVLAFFDVQKKVTVSCDASQTGLGAVLLQEGRPIAYVSRALTSTETRYVQIEKELLAVVFALERFHQYTYGKTVDVESDHKPLEAITQKALCHAPPRLQRMLLRLQKYDFILRYKPGKDLNIADTLSRAYIPDCGSDRMEEELTCAINLVINNIPATDKRMQEIREGTKNDKSLRILKRMILNGWPDIQSQIPEEVQPYWNFRDELSEADGVLLKGERLIIPSCLQQDILQRIHIHGSHGHHQVHSTSQRSCVLARHEQGNHRNGGKV